MVFGAGGGTSSYRELEETDVIILWGSNARDAHPIFFHHVLKGVRNGAKLYTIDPRRTSTAQWSDLWLGLDVGTDIALANAVGREIIKSGLTHRTFIENATTDFEAYEALVESYTLEYAEDVTSLPRESIRELAHSYAKADRAQLCWTLGITEHHNATDNVCALINLALLTAMWVAGAPESCPSAARTTYKAVAIWARFRTSFQASRMSRIRSPGRSSRKHGARISPTRTGSTCRSCSRPWHAETSRHST